MAGTVKTAKKQNSDRIGIMSVVRPEIRFFVLSVLIMEVALGGILPFVPATDRTKLAELILLGIGLLIGAVLIIELRAQSLQQKSGSLESSHADLPKEKSDSSNLATPTTPLITKKADYKDATIQVFLPDWAKDTRDEFYQDGAVQHQAFSHAWADSDQHALTRLKVDYEPMTEGMGARDLLSSMQRLYAEKRATYFLMTMSSKVHCISNAFGQWHSQCKREGKRLPVLISTVASAPNLANVHRGILRWYVRSQEESAVLAQYLRWEKKTRHVGIFFVTHRDGEMASQYGTTGKDIFKDFFSHLEGETRHYAVTAETAAQHVKQWLDSAQDIPDKGAFVIGYGGMMKRTLEALIQNKFQGPIACSSTLTRKEWQPGNTSYDGNICTVLPRLKGSKEHLGGNDRDVVFFFAKETLRRVIEMTSQDADAETFLERWKNGEYQVPPHIAQLCEEHLSNGDTIISLETVSAEIWRSH